VIRTPLAALAASVVAACLAAAPAEADHGNAGSYLAARYAGMTSDYPKAVEYFSRALSLDAQNTDLMEGLMTADVSMGDFKAAGPVLDRLEKAGKVSPLGNIVQLTRWMQTKDYAALEAAYAKGFTLGGLLDGLVRSWAKIGEGDVKGGLAGFDSLAKQPGLGALAAYHKALALAYTGDLQGAEQVLSGKQVAVLATSRRAVLARVELLSSLGRDDEAMKLMTGAFGNMPAPVFAAMVEQLQHGDKLNFDMVASPVDGMAEAFYSVGQALLGDAAPNLVLLYSRTAIELNPKHDDARLLSAIVLEDEAQYKLAEGVYDSVPKGSHAYLEAQLARANALTASGDADGGVAALKALAGTYPQVLQVQVALGDALRRQNQWQAAHDTYDAAVKLIGDTPSAPDWTVFFSRGITLERLGQWPAAEADLRKALSLSPNQPQVLNYLGYSLVEKHEKLDEALSMIQKAVDARPDDGYIVDSLGWALYRLGRYPEAVDQMEKAVQLEAVDPVVNDHLGDVLWAVGRQREARFQWRRALSFVSYGDSSEDVDADRIRRKLEVGLDQVLAEEGAPPLAVAKQN